MSSNDTIFILPNINPLIMVPGFGKFHYSLIFLSGVVMSSTFFETMGVNYVLPVAECDLNITSKQQYGIISGIWFAGKCYELG